MDLVNSLSFVNFSKSSLISSILLEIDLAALIVSLMSFRVSLLSIVDKMLFKWSAAIVISFIKGSTLRISCFDKKINSSRFSCVLSNWSIELTMFSIKFSWFDSFRSWLILLVIFERLDNCFPVIISPWQIINLVTHLSDVGFSMFLGISF